MEVRGNYITHGRALVGYDSNNSLGESWFSEVNKDVGSNKLSKHNHTVKPHTHSVPSHKHTQAIQAATGGYGLITGAGGFLNRVIVDCSIQSKHMYTTTTNLNTSIYQNNSTDNANMGAFGLGQAENVQPYKTDYICRKVSDISENAWFERLSGDTIDSVKREDNSNILPLTYDNSNLQQMHTSFESFYANKPSLNVTPIPRICWNNLFK